MDIDGGRREPDEREHAPLFDGDDPAVAPGPLRLSWRQAYYYLVNIEEHPETLPLVYDTVARRLRETPNPFPEALTASPPAGGHAAAVSRLREHLEERARGASHPWQGESDDLTRRQVLHYFLQYMPTAMVDGCWLQCGTRVAVAHTDVGAALTGLYQHQVRAFVADPGRHFVADYRATFDRLGVPVEEISSRTFAERPDFHEASFELPIFLLGIAPFTRTFSGQILGLNLVWQCLGLSAFGPDLIRETCEAYALPRLGDDLVDPEHLETGRSMACAAALGYLDREHDASNGQDRWSALVQGAAAGLQAWSTWIESTRVSAPAGPPNPRQEMIDLLWRKAPHARGYHAEKRLGARRIDDHLDPATFDGPALLEALAESPWVKAGRADKSMLLGRLIEFGGPMLAVFSPVEQQIIERWIDSLPAADDAAESVEPDGDDDTELARPREPEPRHLDGRGWEANAFRARSERRYGRCTIRELYHHLVNVEFRPDVLPVAERFAKNRLERSRAMLWRGKRPIPARRYDPDALEQWVYAKHRDQVASYRPPGERPDVAKQAFVEATTQLAPLILIDGGWLQGMSSPALIHTVVGRMLFHVLVEEIGEGKPAEHHANIYRDLLGAMGEEPPPVESRAFAEWPRLLDTSFEIPTLWLSISCFPRHFLPEILGLNLAVELAGVGGPYMEARDTLRQFGYPTLFVDVHNAADNVSVGHAAWAMNAIKRYMDEIAERDGPHSVDPAWHRVWTGVRATLPQIGAVRLLAHRVRRRLFGKDPALVPLIFPS